MGSLSDKAENELLDHIFNAAYTPPTTVYLALCTADPTDAGTGASMSECANTNNYARAAITFAAAASRSVAQSGTVTFNQASGSWGTASHWAVVSTNTYGAGDMLAHGSLAASKAIVNGNTPSVAGGEVTVTISAGEVSDYLANIMLDFMFRNQAFSAPDTYVGFTTATVSDGNTGSTITEVSGGSYARVQVNVNGGSSPTWDLATGTTPTEVDNTHEIAFTTATASWGTITSVVICDALTLGNLLFYDNDMADQAVGDGDTAKIAAGALDIQLT